MKWRNSMGQYVDLSKCQGSVQFHFIDQSGIYQVVTLSSFDDFKHFLIDNGGFDLHKMVADEVVKQLRDGQKETHP